MIIDYQQVNIGYANKNIIFDINFSLKKQDFVFLTGKIGSGKSTFLKSIYAEVNISGKKAIVLDFNLIKIKRRKIPKLRQKIGFIFQDFNFLNDRNIFNNLYFVLRATGWKNEVKIKTRIYEIMHLLNIENLAQKMPYELSGGQLQKSAIARALLNNPPLILADEPTINLDRASAFQIIKILFDLSQKMDKSVIVATHNQEILSFIQAPIYKIIDGKIVCNK